MSSTPALTAARVTRIAKQAAPEMRWSSEKGVRGILVRVWDAPADGTDRTELRLLNDARRLINATDLSATVISLRSRGGRSQFRILVTSEAQEAAEMQEAAAARTAAAPRITEDRTIPGSARSIADRLMAKVAPAAAAEPAVTAGEKLTVREAHAVITGTADAATEAKVTVREAAALERVEQPHAPSSLSAGPAARERGLYAVGGTLAELVQFHADPASAVRDAEVMRAHGFGATVYGPCGHPLREYLTRDGVRELEACLRCAQVRQAADVLRAGGRLTGGLRAANVETEARALLTAEDAYDGGVTAQAAAELADPESPAGARLSAAVQSTQAVSAAHAAEDAGLDALTYRSIRASAYEVLDGGEVIGRIVRSRYASDALRWEAYLPGGRKAGHGRTRQEAARAVLRAQTAARTPAPERGYPELTSAEAEEVLSMGAVLITEGAGGYSFAVEERRTHRRLGRIRAVTEKLGGGFWVRYAAYRPDGSRVGYFPRRPDAARVLLP